MHKDFYKTIVEIARSHKPKQFRRDQNLIPNSHYQLERINRQLKKLEQEKKS